MYIWPWHLTPMPYVESENVLAIYKPQAKIVSNMIASVKNVRVVGITLHTAWFYVYLTMTFDYNAIRGIQKRTCHLQTSGKDCVKYDSIRQKCKSSWHYTPYSLILCIFDTWHLTPRPYVENKNILDHLQTSGKDCVKYDNIRQKCKSSWHYTPYSLILCIFDHDIWLQGHTWNPKTYLPSTNLRQRLCQIW